MTAASPVSLRCFAVVVLALMVAPGATAELMSYTQSGDVTVRSPNLTPSIQIRQGVLGGSFLLEDDSIGTVTMVDLSVVRDGGMTANATGFMAVPGAFLYVRTVSTESPAPGQTGTGDTTSSIDWGVLTGWSASGSSFCRSTPPFLCTFAGFFEDGTVPYSLRSSAYEIGTWVFGANGGVGSTPYLHAPLELFTLGGISDSAPGVTTPADESSAVAATALNPETGEVTAGAPNARFLGTTNRSADVAASNVDPTTGELVSGPPNSADHAALDFSAAIAAAVINVATGEITTPPPNSIDFGAVDHSAQVAAASIDVATGEILAGPPNANDEGASNYTAFVADVRANANDGSVDPSGTAFPGATSGMSVPVLSLLGLVALGAGYLGIARLRVRRGPAS